MPKPVLSGFSSLALGAVLFAPVQAAAACPATTEDARRGILVTYDDGLTVASRLMPDGLQEDIESEPDGSGDGYVVLARYGIFPLEEMPVVASRRQVQDRWRFVYPQDIATLPKIVPGLRWQGIVTMIDGTDATEEWQMSVIAGRQIDVVHGGCAFSVIPVVSRATVPDEFDDFIGFDFVPALGLSLYRGYSETALASDLPAIVAIGPYPD